MKIKYNVYWIDLFCGAGGTSTGIHLSRTGKVLACVNHDKDAITAHALNHPRTVHFIEDIRDFEVVIKLNKIIRKIRLSDPLAIINIWASFACQDHSKAKGGQPKDEGNRTLADHIHMYLEHLKPDYFFAENVVEFMDWCPLDQNGKPDKSRKGETYNKWVEEVKKHDYEYDFAILNAADFGAYQSRERLFIQFAKPGLPIAWPVATHNKKGLFGLKKWKAVKHVLDFTDEGNSIFGRKKPLVEASLRRIYIGLVKEVAGGKQAFINQYNGGEGRILSIDNAINTVPTENRFAIFKAVFLSKYYGTGDNVQSVNRPAPTIPTVDTVAAHWIDRQYKTPTMTSIDEPIGALLCVPKANLINCLGFIINPSHGGHISSINNSSPTIIARQDKAPLYLIQTTLGDKPVFTAIDFFNELDLQYMLDNQNEVYGPIIEKSVRVKIVEFMFLYGISDIRQRMLKISELLPIQGFPKNYKLVGSQKTQKKHIGNAVEVGMAKCIAVAHHKALTDYLHIRISA